MVKVVSTVLPGPVEVGPVNFVRFEWWEESPRFVLLRYEVFGKEAKSGVRLDLDKKAILDDLPEREDLNPEIRRRAPDIWTAVMDTKFLH